MKQPEPEVREMGVSEARANMTDVIAQARLLDVDFVLTRRDKPQVVLISVKRYDSAQVHATVFARLRKLCEDPEKEKLLKRLDPGLHLLATSEKS